MNFASISQAERDEIFKEQLCAEKRAIIEKYDLHVTPRQYWVQRKENAHERIFFKHAYLIKHDIMSILFRCNYLCFGKLKYFRSQQERFSPYLYDALEGFVPTQLWNAEFLKDEISGCFIDFRRLQQITAIEDFEAFIQRLDNLGGSQL